MFYIHLSVAQIHLPVPSCPFAQADAIHSGRVPPPEIASEMYDTIEAAEGIDESTVPSQSYVPDQHGQQLPVQPAAFPGAGSPLGNAPGPGAGAGIGAGAGAGAGAGVGLGGVPGQGNQTVFDANKH